MPRKATPPRLILFGPDTKNGARKKRKLTRYIWYIVWVENSRTQMHSTGETNQVEAETYFGEWLGTRKIGQGVDDKIAISAILESYYQEHGPEVAAPDAIFWRIDPLKRFFNGGLEQVSKDSSKAYVAHRASENVKASTAGTELRTLRAAINHCHKAGYIATAPYVWSPEPPTPREVWLTRSEAARLLRVARGFKAAWHICLFILISLYTGQRKEAVLRLQFSKNPAGGHVDLENDLIYWQKAGRQTNKRQPKATKIHHRLRPFLVAARKRSIGHYVIEYRGKRISTPNITFKKMVKIAGLIDVIPHTLCHTAITWMLQGGAEKGEVAKAVGKSEDMIEKVYGHHSPDHMKSVLRALN